MGRPLAGLWRGAQAVILAFAGAMATACAANAESVVVAPPAQDQDYRQWQAITLDFTGPEMSEGGESNPFTDTRLLVEFSHGDKRRVVRGFFAADGNAGESGAEAGSVWRVRFMPDLVGDWSYGARLEIGENVALAPVAGSSGQLVGEWNGSFEVKPTDSDAVGFYRHGLLQRSGRYFRFAESGEYWLKGGANSPENLLGYADFDGTYRMSDNARDGEADAGGSIHTFSPHMQDWRSVDPSWRDGKGKGLIGAVNYLADQGMNAAYFLVMNVDGDGKDVWPWHNPGDPTRFDVSKLAQWEIVFAHMQRRGIALHIVLQETENELLLDRGDTGPMRQLFLQEMIARFAHHPALFWNLGEENGPVHWRPEGQNDAQREAMARFIAANDPYRHPILLHTHSEAEDKDAIVAPLLGNPDLDGLSFQVSRRETVNAEIRKWHSLSDDAGRIWPITMDEIGMWQVGARADKDDPTHDSLRRHALWGNLLAGGAGVEWYFGAEQDGNDLTTEDWRSRHELWRQTRIALEFFKENLPFAEMLPCYGAAYCLQRPGDIYAIYLSEETPKLETGTIMPGAYRLRLFDPVRGLFDQVERVVSITSAGLSEQLRVPADGDDRVALLTRVEQASTIND